MLIVIFVMLYSSLIMPCFYNSFPLSIYQAMTDWSSAMHQFTWNHDVCLISNILMCLLEFESVSYYSQNISSTSLM